MKLPLLTGKSLDALEVLESPGRALFAFSDGSSISVECDWRIVLDGRIVLAARDHRQPLGRLGRPQPLDAMRVGLALLSGRRITRASLGSTGDLAIVFDCSVHEQPSLIIGAENSIIRLETFTNSCGYESCTINLSDGSRYVVLGGGQVLEFARTRAAQLGDEADER